ncbi:hypothetical protein QO004_002752 [Rhizobium mesoamericanum]|nr:hypothetical protein [Rhizobium mesoamericanum]
MYMNPHVRIVSTGTDRVWPASTISPVLYQSPRQRQGRPVMDWHHVLGRGQRRWRSNSGAPSGRLNTGVITYGRRQQRDRTV